MEKVATKDSSVRLVIAAGLNALLWLATQAKDYGDPLRAGQLVLSGALGPFVPFSPGDEVVATISTLGSITARFK